MSKEKEFQELKHREATTASLSRDEVVSTCESLFNVALRFLNDRKAATAVALDVYDVRLVDRETGYLVDCPPSLDSMKFDAVSAARLRLRESLERGVTLLSFARREHLPVTPGATQGVLREIWKVLIGLPEPLKVVVQTRYFAALSSAEIAEATKYATSLIQDMLVGACALLYRPLSARAEEVLAPILLERTEPSWPTVPAPEELAGDLVLRETFETSDSVSTRKTMRSSGPGDSISPTGRRKR